MSKLHADINLEVLYIIYWH